MGEHEHEEEEEREVGNVENSDGEELWLVANVEKKVEDEERETVIYQKTLEEQEQKMNKWGLEKGRWRKKEGRGEEEQGRTLRQQGQRRGEEGDEDGWNVVARRGRFRGMRMKAGGGERGERREIQVAEKEVGKMGVGDATKEAGKCAMMFHVTDSKRVLAAVSRIVEAGNEVKFGRGPGKAT